MKTTSESSVTVVVPAFRAVSTIDRALRSVIGDPNVREIIVVDDGCPEGTGAYVESTQSGRTEVKVLKHGSNRGPAAARNTGIREATGAWVAVLDADDTFLEGRLERLLSSPVGASADVISDNVVNWEMSADRYSAPLVRSTIPVPLTITQFVDRARPLTREMDLGLLKPIIRTDFVKSIGLYDEEIRHGEDFHLYFDLLAAGATWVHVDYPGYTWTTRSSGTSQTRTDYVDQARRTTSLLRNEATLSTPGLAVAVARRAEALYRFDLRTRALGAARSFKVATAVRLLRQDPALAASLLATGLRRVGSKAALRPCQPLGGGTRANPRAD